MQRWRSERSVYRPLGDAAICAKTSPRLFPETPVSKRERNVLVLILIMILAPRAALEPYATLDLLGLYVMYVSSTISIAWEMLQSELTEFLGLC